ncbi:unnamed protein product [Bemisia tabaci]|uniref:Uncharacterized protein n=1 Tax=Bemisia tabaci TaxID=7038 RepID=A0A9P0F9N2_BEMTA|nr:unnamed protein product [Bemisia tabaci]
MSPQTRRNTDVYLIGSYFSQIVGSKLPSNGDALKVLFFNIREVKHSLRESAHLVIDEILSFWNKARIPTKHRSDCVKKLVNSDTLKFFTKFGLPTNFLQKDPSTWCNDDEYKSISKKVCKLKSVNDVAERGVKLIEEYNGRLTKDPAQQQNILKLVEDYRKNFPECTKETLCQPLL